MPSDTAMPEQGTEKQREWVSKFAEVAGVAKAQAKREAAQKRAISLTVLPLQEDGALAGLDFTMKIRTDSSLKSRFLAKFGVQQEMRSLTGTGAAMNEIDTHHDLHSLEAISRDNLVKAGQAMAKIEKASADLDTQLMPVFLEEQGIDVTALAPDDLAALEEEYQTILHDRLYPVSAEDKKRRKAEQEQAHAEFLTTLTPEEREKAERKKQARAETLEQYLGKYEAAKGKVETVVREEVYMPLVRSGTMPENLVPDRFSEVARTFQGASEAYNERLKEYTKNAGEHDELLRTLGVASELVSKTADMVTGVLGMVPGSEGVEIAKTAVEVFSIVQAGAFDATKKIIEQKDAASIADAVAGTIGAAVDKIPALKGVAPFIKGGANLAVTGVRTIQGIAHGDPDAVIGALADGLVQGLAIADAKDGTDYAKTIGPMVAGGIKTLGKSSKLMMALRAKPPNQKEIEAAFGELLTQGIGTLADCLGTVVGETTGNKDAVKGIEIAGKGLAGIATSLLSDDKVGGIAAALGNAADECCAAYLPGAYGPAIGKGLKGAFTGGGALTKAFQARDPNAALKAIVGMVQDGLGAALASDAVDSNPTAKLAVEETAGAIDKLVKLTALAQALKSGSLSDIENAINDLLEAVADDLSKRLPPDDETEPKTEEGAEGEESEADEEEDEDEDEDEEEEAEEEEEEDPVAEQAESLARDNETMSRSKMALAQEVLDNPAATPEQKRAAELQKQMAEDELKEQAELAESFQTASVEFTQMLSASFPSEEPDPNEDLPTLKQMIAKLERDKKIFEMVNSFVDMGLKTAATFFPPMAAAFDFKKFTVEIGLAVAHAKALLEWKKNVKDARNAVTVQAHAMLSRVKLEEDAVIEHNIRAAIALTSAIGNVLVTVGAQAAPVGAGLVAGAKVAEAGLEIALTIKSEVEMRTAWNGYLKALKNPKDRKVVRMAMQNNPSLAKYAMAWGALKDNNPIAKEALRKCGITDAVLAKENEGIKDVVTYLETLYADDPVVLRSMPDTKEWGWDPPDPELTVRGWAKFLAAAQSRKGQMKAGTGGAIGAAIQTVEGAKAEVRVAVAEFEKARNFTKRREIRKMMEGAPTKKDSAPPDRAAMQLTVKLNVVETRTKDCVSVLAALQVELSKFQPLDTRDQPYPRIREYLDALDALSELDQKKLEKEIAKLKDAA